MRPILLLLCVATLWAGDLNRRLDLTLKRTLEGGPPRYELDFLAADLIPREVRRFTNFSGDLSGRYLGALAAVESYRPQARGKLRAALREFVTHQREAGHFGDALSGSGAADDDMARLWGSGRMLVGLLEAAEKTGSPEALEAARRLGDFLASVGERFNSDSVRKEFSDGHLATGYICWTQNIEGLVGLYRASGEERYLRLAGELADRVERRPGQHSHGWLTSLRGVLELSEEAGEPGRLAQVERAWEEFVESPNLLLTGGVPEYFEPGIARDEGCSEADWLRLNLRLWALTGKMRYLEYGERAWFNAFSLNQFPSGDFGHVTLSAEGLGYGGGRAWWCCTLHGLRTFPSVIEAALRLDGETIYYDLPVDSRIEAAGFALRAESRLESDARVELEAEGSSDGAVRVAVRQPSWSGRVELRLNGAETAGDERDGYVAIERLWSDGDVLEVRYEPTTRVVRDHEAQAVYRGPWLLGVSEAQTPELFDEPHEHNTVDLTDLRESEQPGRLLVSYRPAGYAEQLGEAVLRPVAERTWGETGLRWVLRFGAQGAGAAERRRGVWVWAQPAIYGALVGLAAGWWMTRRRSRRG